MFCPKCGEKNKESANFCVKCGENFKTKKTAKKVNEQKYDFNNLNIVDPLKIVNDDKEKLIELSENIINGKEKNGIDKISIILSKYMNIKFEKIIEIYNSIKTNRLEATDV